MGLAFDKPKKVLIVEDEDDVRSLLENWLALISEGKILVTKARNGQEGINKSIFVKYDMIITDLKMPVKDGSTFIEEVRTKSSNTDTPIAVVSGFSGDGVERRFQKVQVFEKPIDTQRFKQYLAEQLTLSAEEATDSVASALERIFQNLTDYLSKTNGLEISRKPILAKPSLESLSGDFCHTLSLKSKNGVSIVAISFSKELLAETYKKMNRPPEPPSPGPTLKQIIKDSIQDPAIKDHQVEASPFVEFVKEAGLSFEFSTREGNFWVYAFWRPHV